MANEETSHRVKLPLYDLRPRIENCWVAPNSTIGKSPSTFAMINSFHVSNNGRGADNNDDFALS